MNCPQCGSPVSPGVDACGTCGTQLASYARPDNGPAGAAAPAGAPVGTAGAAAPAGWNQSGSAAASYSFDVARWTLDDRITGGATLLVLISLFLPWFSVSVSGIEGLGGGSASASGTTAHGWLWIVFIIGLAELVYLAAVAGIQRMPALPLKHERLLLITSGLTLLLVLIAFLLKPGNDGLAEVKIGWDFGAFVAIIAAIIAFVPSARAALAERNGTHSASR